MDDDEFEDMVGGERLEWYRLTPAERWRISNTELWATFLALGGRLTILSTHRALSSIGKQ